MVGIVSERLLALPQSASVCFVPSSFKIKTVDSTIILEVSKYL